MRLMQRKERLPIAEGLPPEAIDDLSLMMRAARRAGHLIRAGYVGEHNITEKGLGDLVTRLDYDSDRAIQDEIRASHPKDKIVSEELSPDVDPRKGRVWIVDPLDGTSAFHFNVSPDMPSVMIAKLEDGVSQYSTVYFPMTDEMFYAAHGLGAYKGRERLQCSDGPLDKSWVEMNQYSEVGYESGVFRGLRENLRRKGGPRLVSSSPPHSGLGVRIAEGNKRLSAVIHDNGSDKVKQEPWDVIPVALILEEAGGVVVNFDGEPYDPFRPEPFIMAASNGLAQAIIERSRPMAG